MDTTILPFSVAKDIVTLGGALNDDDTPAIVKRIQKISEKTSDAADDAADGDFL